MVDDSNPEGMKGKETDREQEKEKKRKERIMILETMCDMAVCGGAVGQSQSSFEHKRHFSNGATPPPCMKIAFHVHGLLPSKRGIRMARKKQQQGEANEARPTNQQRQPGQPVCLTPTSIECKASVQAGSPPIHPQP